MAEANWEALDGAYDMDVLQLPLDRFCNRVMAWAKSQIHSREWEAFRFRMELPPIGETPASGPWSEEAMASTWQRAGV